jgi:hypothetical protein
MHLGLVGGCRHPATNEPVAFRFDDRYLHVRERGPTSVLADVLTIAIVAKRPDRVFRGLKRNGKEDAFALLGRPSERYLLNAEGEPYTVPVSDKKRFFVFLTEHCCIYHHCWVDLDFECPGQQATEAENTYVTMCFEEEVTNAREA